MVSQLFLWFVNLLAITHCLVIKSYLYYLFAMDVNNLVKRANVCLVPKLSQQLMLQNYCRFGSLLACETFHADVHAGNLLVLRDGRVGFIDFG